MIMKLLGYDLIRLSEDLYDATIVFKEESIFNIILACEDEGFDIISFDESKAIVKKLND